MSRKWLFTILAVLGAAGAVVSQEFGLTVKLGSVVAAIAGVLVYVFNEAKADIANIGSQAGRWTDPKFLTAMVVAIVGALGSQMTLPIAPEIIIAVLTAIIQALFQKDARIKALKARKAGI